MNVFQKFGIKHLSSSQITTFAGDPAYWFASRVLGLKGTVSAAMERGKAVETAVAAFLMGAEIDEALDKAYAEFDKANRFGTLTGDADKERAGIAGMVEQAVNFLAIHGKPDVPSEGGQHKIELKMRFGDQPDDTIPIIGYLDFVFDDCIIDLKTTFAVPSTMKWAHACQAAIYQRKAGNKTVKFLYVSPKKSALLVPEDVETRQEEVRQMVRRMAALLSLGDKEDIRKAVPVIMESFYWRGLEYQRKELLGI